MAQEDVAPLPEPVLVQDEQAVVPSRGDDLDDLDLLNRVEEQRLAELEARLAAVQASLDSANQQLGYLQPLIDSIREIESLETRPERKRSTWLDRKLF